MKWLASIANGSPVTGYTVTPYIGLVAQPTITFNSTATTQTITGLVNGTAYTFRVAAFNAVGTGPTSTITAIIVGAPPAPTAVTAVAGSGQATVNWVAPANNGSAITGYVVTPYIGLTALAPRPFATTATTQIITGLTAGTTYTFKVQATNARGTGAFSAASNAVKVL